MLVDTSLDQSPMLICARSEAGGLGELAYVQSLQIVVGRQLKLNQCGHGLPMRQKRVPWVMKP